METKINVDKNPEEGNALQVKEGNAPVRQEFISVYSVAIIEDVLIRQLSVTSFQFRYSLHRNSFNISTDEKTNVSLRATKDFVTYFRIFWT